MASRTASNRIDGALFLLRVILGCVFVMHGGQKLFVYGLSGTAAAFTHMGIPLPGIIGPFIGVVEFLAGIALIIGLFTRLATLCIAADMIGAILFVHFKNGFFLPTGYEFPFTLLGTSIALMLAGPGGYSVDAILAGRRADAAVQPTLRR